MAYRKFEPYEIEFSYERDPSFKRFTLPGSVFPVTFPVLKNYTIRFNFANIKKIDVYNSDFSQAEADAEQIEFVEIHDIPFLGGQLLLLNGHICYIKKTEGAPIT